MIRFRKIKLSIFDILFLIVCLIFGLLFTTLSTLRYEHFMTGSYDLAIYDQGIWHYSRFESPVSTVKGMNILGDHFSPILVFLSPSFWFFHDAKIILIFQAFVVSLSAFFLYLILTKWFKSQIAAFLLSLTFFLFLGLQYALDYDFHLVSLSVFPLSLIFFGLFLNKNLYYWIGVVIAFLLKEDLPVIICFIGLYEYLILKKKNLGLITIFLSASYFLLETKILMPFFQNNSLVAKNYIDFYDLGKTSDIMISNSLTNPLMILSVMFNSPIKIDTFISTLQSFLFLPVLSPLFWLTSLPIWMERFLSSTIDRWKFELYYGISLTPILVLASGQAIIFIQKILIRFGFNFRYLVIILASLTLTYSFYINIINHAPLTRLIHVQYYQLTEVEKSLQDVIRLIPANSSVSAQQPFVAHLSHREELFWFPEKSDQAEYIALVKGRPATPLSNVELNEYVDQFLKNDNLKVIYNQNGAYLFRKSK